MRFRANTNDMHVRVYLVNDGRIDCSEVAGYAAAGNMVADFTDVDILTGNAWHQLTDTVTTAGTNRSLLISVTHMGDTAPPATTRAYFDDIHLFGNGCAPGWKEPQSFRNTYGSLSTGDICAFLAASIAADGSPTHAFIDRFRTFCGMDECTPTELIAPPIQQLNRKVARGADDRALIQIAPNPSQGIYRLTLAQPPTAPLQVVVYDATGRTVSVLPMNTRSLDIDLGAQPAGAYLLEVYDGERIEHAWLVKE
jgi:hypothetical protein